MLRLYLSPMVRLHIWDTRYKVAGVSDIHNHPWDFTSEIIAGEITNKLYTVANTKEAIGAAVYLRSGIICGPGGGLDSRGAVAVKLIPTSIETFVAGDTYHQTSHQVHCSCPLNGTVTLVTRTFKDQTEHADVFWPEGTKWGSAEPRAASENEVMDIVNYSLERWF